MTSIARTQRPRSNAAGRLLEDYGRDRSRGRALRAQLADRFPDRSGDEVEEAVQSACQSFLDEAPGITDPGRAYAWLRTVSYRAMLHQLQAQRRVAPADPTDAVIGAAEAEGPGPAEELIALEEDSELGLLVEEVASSLTDERRRVFALWAVGRKRPEIAAELGMSERAVKKALEKIMREARGVLAQKAGGGCEEGEPLVLRLACGLAEAGEAAQARIHLHQCGRCSAFSEQLEGWREKAAVVLPPVAAEAANPGLVERTVGRVGDAIGSARRHLLDGGAQVKQQATMAGVSRSTDPTPLIGARPGAVVAVVAGCLAIGGGAATYCAQQGVDPLGAAQDLIGGSQEEPARQEPSPPAAEEPVTPAETPAVTGPTYETVQEAPATEATPTEEPKAKSEPEPATTESRATESAEPVEEEETAPPPEQSFEPASPDYPATESKISSSSESSSSSGSTESAKATAVPANEAPQFGGP
jgi:DNA-directed RNA polymerase specialized sigma24 family protein